MTTGATPGVVFVTIPPGLGRELAKGLVEEKLAACVQIVSSVVSVYEWQGTIEEEPEALLIVKTTEEMVKKMGRYLDEHHPYDVPECVFVPIASGSPDYLAWIAETLD